MDDRLLAAAIHAFPRRFRMSRGAEMQSTLADVVSADPRPTAQLHAALDLVLAGWALRRRTRPPLRQYLGHRIFGTRLQEQYHPWLFDDLDGWFRYRQPGMIMTAVALVNVLMPFVLGGRPSDNPYLIWSFVIWTAAVVVVAQVPYFARRDRERILRKNGYVGNDHSPR